MSTFDDVMGVLTKQFARMSDEEKLEVTRKIWGEKFSFVDPVEWGEVVGRIETGRRFLSPPAKEDGYYEKKGEFFLEDDGKGLLPF